MLTLACPGKVMLLTAPTVTKQVLVLLPSTVCAVITLVPILLLLFAVTKPLLETLHTAVLEVHVTLLFVALLGAIVGVNCKVVPKNKDAVFWDKDTLDTGAFIVTLHEALYIPSTVMTLAIELPEVFAVINPLLSTEILLLLADHVTDLFDAPLGVTVYDSCNVLEGAKVDIVGDTVTPVTDTKAADTVIAYDAEISRLLTDVHEMILSPTAILRISPPLTVATDVLLDPHVTELLLAVDGVTTHVACRVLPTLITLALALIVRPVTDGSNAPASNAPLREPKPVQKSYPTRALKAPLLPILVS